MPIVVFAVGPADSHSPCPLTRPIRLINAITAPDTSQTLCPLTQPIRLTNAFPDPDNLSANATNTAHCKPTSPGQTGSGVGEVAHVFVTGSCVW